MLLFMGRSRNGERVRRILEEQLQSYVFFRGKLFRGEVQQFREPPPPPPISVSQGLKHGCISELCHGLMVAIRDEYSLQYSL
jgi:hypothetical protein